MSGLAKFQSCSEPGWIGKVKTEKPADKIGRSDRILPNDGEPYVSEATNILLLKRIAKGGVGPRDSRSPRSSTTPSGGAGRTNRRLRTMNDRYIKELSELPRVYPQTRGRSGIRAVCP